MGRASRTVFTMLIAAGLFASMRPALAASADESDFFSRINYERSTRGIKTLTLDANLSDIARRHSQDMANKGELYHNDNLGNEVSGWQELDENVGEGPSVADIHQAFMNSQVHRDAILGNYEKVGVGTVWKDDTLWVTEVFFRAYHASQPAPRPTRHAGTVPPRTAPARTAVQTIRVASFPPRPARPVAPTAPSIPDGVLLPLTPGMLEKLLGDLVIAGPAGESGDAAGVPDPQPSGGDTQAMPALSAPRVATRLGAFLWELVDRAA